MTHPGFSLVTTGCAVLVRSGPQIRKVERLPRLGCNEALGINTGMGYTFQQLLPSASRPSSVNRKVPQWIPNARRAPMS
jgi:hypothetical protein